MTTLDRIPAAIREEDDPSWRQWRYEPPQLQLPILVAHWPEDNPVTVLLDGPNIHPMANILGLFWMPSGLYREEFWRCTGKWK